MKKIQQKEIAAALNVGPNTVNNWLQGNTSMKAEQVPLIAKFLGVSVSELFEENIRPKKDSKTYKNERQPEVVNEILICKECKAKDKDIEDLRLELLNLHRKYNQALEELQDKKTDCG